MTEGTLKDIMYTLDDLHFMLLESRLSRADKDKMQARITSTLNRITVEQVKEAAE
jgi:hypothetical protein